MEMYRKQALLLPIGAYVITRRPLETIKYILLSVPAKDMHTSLKTMLLNQLCWPLDDSIDLKCSID